MASGLDGVGSVKGVGLEWHLEEIAADDRGERRNALLLVVVLCPPNLVLVDCEASDMGSRDRGDGSEVASDTTATVNALHSRLEADEGGNASLVSDLGCLPVLSRELG